jgi:hypothetical protein
MREPMPATLGAGSSAGIDVRVTLATRSKIATISGEVEIIRGEA